MEAEPGTNMLRGNDQLWCYHREFVLRLAVQTWTANQLCTGTIRATVSEVALHGRRATFYSGYDEIAVRNITYLGSIPIGGDRLAKPFSGSV